MPNLIPAHKPSRLKAPLHKTRPEQPRPSPHRRGYTRRWERERLMWLRAHPMCHDCGRPANQVHHIVPIRDGGMYAPENKMSLCGRCHSRRTARGE